MSLTIRFMVKRRGVATKKLENIFKKIVAEKFGHLQWGDFAETAAVRHRGKLHFVSGNLARTREGDVGLARRVKQSFSIFFIL